MASDHERPEVDGVAPAVAGIDALRCSPDATVVLDRELRVRLANAAAVRALGAGDDELLGRRLSELGLPVELVAELEHDAADVLAAGTVVRREHRLPGGVADVVMYGAGAPGAVPGFVVAVARDGRLERRVRERLRRSEAELSAVQEALGVGTWRVDGTTGRVELSAQAYRLCGFDPGSVDPAVVLSCLVGDAEPLWERLRHAPFHATPCATGPSLVELQRLGEPAGDGSLWGLVRVLPPAPADDASLDRVLADAAELAELLVFRVVPDERLEPLTSAARRWLRRGGWELGTTTVVGDDGARTPLRCSGVFEQLRTGDTLREQAVETTVAGETRRFLVSGGSVPAGPDRPGDMFIVARDVTEVERAEQALRDAKHRIAAFVAAMDGLSASHSIVTWQVDVRTGRTHVLSESAARVLGCEPRVVEGDASVYVERLHPDDGKAFVAAVAGLRESGGADLNVRYRRPSDGAERLHRVMMVAERVDDHVVAVSGVTIDLSETAPAPAPVASGDLEGLVEGVDPTEWRDLDPRVLPGWDDLTEREREVVELTAKGYRSQAIGRMLFLSSSTVRNHLSTAYRKLGVRSQVELAGRLARTSLARTRPDVTA